MKDKEWLKEEIASMFTSAYELGKIEYYELEQTIERLSELIDQLDEPEVLSQKWVDEHKKSYTMEDSVEISDLQNLLVPKQEKPEVEENFYTFDNAKKWLQDNGFVVFEKEKLDEEVQRMIDETYKTMNEIPVIPQFVADWDYENKEDALVDSIHSSRYSLELNYWNLIDRVIYGYEVEKEKLYHVKDNNETLLCKVDGKVMTVMTVTKTWYIGYEQEFYRLTEKEIKEYDERYWAFAQEVTE